MKKVRPRMTAAAVNGAWAIIPTPAKAGADRWDAKDTVDVDETVRIVEEMIKVGADALLTLGTLGEAAAATLNWDEKRTFISTVVETARGRIPIFAGTTTLNTRDTIEQTKW
jgi:trans-o-hydroxybenzylidenepyruvate hydratase-aldolase